MPLKRERERELYLKWDNDCQIIETDYLGETLSLSKVFHFSLLWYCLEYWKWIKEIDRGFKLKQFHKFKALIEKIKNLGPNMK